MVSIIIPCYNGGMYVDRCMCSIYMQTYPQIEVIVVNDGSQDNSEEKIISWKEPFIKKGYKLIYVYQENQGTGSAVNTGLKYVSGEFISLLDIDDEYLPEAIAQRVDYMEQHKNVDVVRSNGWYVRDCGKSLFINDKPEKEIKDVFAALLEGKTNNWAGSYMVRASALFQFYPKREIYQSRHGQNLQLLLPLIYKKECGYIDEPHMNYNQVENSLTKTAEQSLVRTRNLENARGYRDIREYMVRSIVKDDAEREFFLHLIQNAYWRGIMQIAVSLDDKMLLKEAYGELKKLTKLTLDDKIIFYRLLCPVKVLPLRICRKVKNCVRKGNI